MSYKMTDFFSFLFFYITKALLFCVVVAQWCWSVGVSTTKWVQWIWQSQMFERHSGETVNAEPKTAKVKNQTPSWLMRLAGDSWSVGHRFKGGCERTRDSSVSPQESHPDSRSLFPRSSLTPGGQSCSLTDQPAPPHPRTWAAVGFVSDVFPDESALLIGPLRGLRLLLLLLLLCNAAGTESQVQITERKKKKKISPK